MMEMYCLSKALIDFNNNLTRKNHLVILLCKDNQYIYKFELDVHEDGINDDENIIIVDRIIKMLLYSIGADSIHIFGSKIIFEKIRDTYCKDGLRNYEYEFFTSIYGKEFKVCYLYNLDNVILVSNYQKISFSAYNNVIGIDVGGSDIKVCCFINNTLIYKDEFVWLPKEHENIDYHINMIKLVINKALNKINNVDCINISSAGVIINNQIKKANLFEKISPNMPKEEIYNFYINIIKSLNKNIKYCILNDGDVSAIAGHYYMKKNNILGLALGTSLAAGYYKNNQLNGWINELSFVPFDLSDNAIYEEKSNDKGLAGKYFSQDGVIYLANKFKIKIDETLSKYEKLKYVQNLVEKNDEVAIKVFKNIGMYLALFLKQISLIYDLENIIIQGRVVSGCAGNILFKSLKQKIEELNLNVNVYLPGEDIRRLGQAIAVSKITTD